MTLKTFRDTIGHIVVLNLIILTFLLVENVCLVFNHGTRFYNFTNQYNKCKNYCKKLTKFLNIELISMTNLRIIVSICY